jgi:hypothetical protein
MPDGVAVNANLVTDRRFHDRLPLLKFRCRDVHSCLYRRGTLPHAGWGTPHSQDTGQPQSQNGKDCVTLAGWAMSLLISSSPRVRGLPRGFLFVPWCR